MPDGLYSLSHFQEVNAVAVQGFGTIPGQGCTRCRDASKFRHFDLCKIRFSFSPACGNCLMTHHPECCSFRTFPYIPAVVFANACSHQMTTIRPRLRSDNLSSLLHSSLPTGLLAPAVALACRAILAMSICPASLLAAALRHHLFILDLALLVQTLSLPLVLSHPPPRPLMDRALPPSLHLRL
jgi:hypothetical protein